MVSARLRYSLLLSLLPCIAPMGCGAADSGFPAYDPNSLVGVWKARSITNGTTSQTCPATFTSPPNSTFQYGTVGCTGQEMFTFYKDGKCRINGGTPAATYAISPSAGTRLVTISDCPSGPPDLPCREYRGVFDLTNRTLTIRLTGDDTNFVNIVYWREIVGG